MYVHPGAKVLTKLTLHFLVLDLCYTISVFVIRLSCNGSMDSLEDCVISWFCKSMGNKEAAWNKECFMEKQTGFVSFFVKKSRPVLCLRPLIPVKYIAVKKVGTTSLKHLF